MTEKLPKYVQNANRILEILEAQPEKLWNRTQRELAEVIGISLAELSSLLKTLVEAGKIRKGASLPGHRGRTSVIHLVDSTPFNSSIRRELNRQTNDRAMTPEEEINHVVALDSITLDQIGMAVIRSLKSAWESEETYNKNRNEQLNKIREFRDRLSEERELRQRLVNERDSIRRQIEELEQDRSRMQAEINRLLMSTHQSKAGGTFKVRDMLDEDEVRMLESLMKAKPGFYRDSDREVGVAS